MRRQFGHTQAIPKKRIYCGWCGEKRTYKAKEDAQHSIESAPKHAKLHMYWCGFAEGWRLSSKE